MAALELVLIAVLAAGAVFAAARGTERRLRAALAAGLLTAAGATAGFGAGRTRAEPAPGAPRRSEASNGVGSGACRGCHPAEHASWRRSFHRTMTQLATPETVLGPFDGTPIEVEGRSVELSRRGAELWARLPDPEFVAAAIRGGNPSAAAAAPLVSRRVVLATGSHHQQVYWVRGERGNELRLVPLSYLIAERRYVPRKDAFLQPPDAPPHAIRWNSNCIQCHTTLGRPRHDEATDQFASESVELGIACEACHGEAAEHVARHQNPLTRFAAHLTDAPDPSIVNPARLDAARASELCGQCHAYFVPRDEARWWSDGFAGSYRPGEALEATRTLVSVAQRGAAAPATGAGVDAAPESLFWKDGTIRVGGRELNALELSACFRAGQGKRKLSCLSCHSQHRSDPEDQLWKGSPDAPCARCHAEIARRASEHSHHAPGSPGNSCVACHMPFTSYALFKGIRSHRIDSPSAELTATSERPNACNLCHVDRTLEWTAEALARFYARATPSLDRRTRDVALVLDDLLAGDAAERAIAAYALGRREAQQAAGTGFQAAALAELLTDPYAAVRKVACDALGTLPGFQDFDCDFLADPADRAQKRQAALQRFRSLPGRRSDPVLLLDSAGAPDQARIAALLAARDQRPMTIAE
jgi:predicted CXXCH cytochrome family protein